MRAARGIFAGLSLLGLVAGAPGSSCDEESQGSGVDETTSERPVSSAGYDDCAVGGRCDCSRIQDKDSEGYFACVTDPSCERCWAGTSTATEASAPTLTPSSLTNSTASREASSGAAPKPTTEATPTSTDYRTMPPGTYTASGSNVVSIIIVPEPKSTPTSSPHVVTVFETTIVTVAVTAEASSSSSSSSSAAPAEVACPNLCDCAAIRDRDSAEYYKCLTNPSCEACRVASSSPPSPDPRTPTSTVPQPAPTSDSPSSTPATSPASAATSTTTSARPRPSCPQNCDCSKIEDKQSDEYFQCVTNPNCERCRAGGGGA